MVFTSPKTIGRFKSLCLQIELSSGIKSSYRTFGNNRFPCRTPELLGPIINVNVNLHNVAFLAHVYCFKSLGIKRKEKAWLLIPSAAFYAQLCTFRIFIQCEKLFTPWQALCWWKSVRKPLINIVKNKGDLYTSTTRETSEMIREIYGFE